jgi:uncharacterized membrane protein
VQRDSGSIPFFLYVIAAAVFVWASSQFLPEVVASHFSASGDANGFMPRASYTWFMVVIVALLPVLVVVLPNSVMSRPKARFNLPNRSHWLAPERRVETVAYLCAASRRFGYLLVTFVGYTHWLVVRANSVDPPALNSNWFIGGLVMFAVAVVAQLVAIFRRFGRVPVRSA